MEKDPKFTASEPSGTWSRGSVDVFVYGTSSSRYERYLVEVGR